MYSVQMPPLNRWHKTSEQLPYGADVVMGWVTVGQFKYVAQLIFVGNEFLHEFQLAGHSVSCSHWLPITVEEEVSTLQIEDTDDLLDDLFHAVDCRGGSPELDSLVVRASQEIERLRGHLETIQGFANDPAFESDVMGWIERECRDALDPGWLDRLEEST